MNRGEKDKEENVWGEAMIEQQGGRVWGEGRGGVRMGVERRGRKSGGDTGNEIRGNEREREGKRGGEGGRGERGNGER